MALYRISGIWKDSNNVITHYAFHQISSDNSALRAVKRTKAQAVQLLEISGNSATTWIWNYSASRWVIGENVQVVNGASGKYLRTDPDQRISDNLSHLVDYDWLS